MCVCVCVCVCKDGCCRSEERIKIYFKIGRSTKTFVFFVKNTNFFVDLPILIYIYKQNKTKIYFHDVIIDLFLVVNPSSDVERTFLFGCSYIASGENGI